MNTKENAVHTSRIRSIVPLLAAGLLALLAGVLVHVNRADLADAKAGWIQLETQAGDGLFPG